MASAPPEALLVRGRAEVTDVAGIVPEYRPAQYRYGTPEQAAAALASVSRPGTRMARIAVRPTRVGLLDFTTGFPGGGGDRGEVRAARPVLSAAAGGAAGPERRRGRCGRSRETGAAACRAGGGLPPVTPGVAWGGANMPAFGGGIGAAPEKTATHG